MKRAVGVEDVSPILQSRGHLLAEGWTERSIAAAIATRSLVSIRRGWYMEATEWRELWPEGRHLAHVVAAVRDARSSVVMSHTSAAVLWGLPLYRVVPRRVHLTMTRRRRNSSSPDILRHTAALPDGDVVRRGGILCTSLGRTVIDLARLLPTDAAVALADAAERQMSVRGRVWDRDARAVWREELAERLGRARGSRGVRAGRQVVAFADGRAELPGESVSRLQLARLGFAPPELQVRFGAPGGGDYFVDFRLPDARALGEFDGKTKYVDEAIRQGRPLDDILLAEKQREDWIRGLSQERFARWGDEHIGSPAALGARLAAFGIRPPA